MRIVLLAHALRGQGGWISGRNFVKALKKVAPEHHYLVTAPTGCSYEELSLPDGSAYHFCPSSISLFERIRFEQYQLPDIIRRFRPDVVLGLGNHGTKYVGCPQAIWIRNGYLVYPAKHFPKASLKTRIHVYLQKLYLRKTLAHTDLVFCQTPVMQKRLSDYYSYPESKIRHLPNAISSFLKQIGSEEKPPDGIEKGKFNCLVLSRYYIHKNPKILIDECLRSPDSFDGICFITTVSENDGRHASFGRTQAARTVFPYLA
jgi:glycosyltransferase involved in cell wall biosynthesis